MLPEAQKEVLLSRQDLRQLWGSESNSNITESPARKQTDFHAGRMETSQWQGSMGVIFCSILLPFLRTGADSPSKGKKGVLRSASGSRPNLQV